jgi:ubiquinone/menaquinone biosynthesis C-methylase UbiE
MQLELEERKIKEIEHSDRRRQIVTAYEYQTDASQEDKNQAFIQDTEEYKKHFSNIKFYSISRTSFAYRDRLLYSDIKDKTVLDYCCGNGEIGIEMAKQGAREVHGIDISSVAINNATALAQKENVANKCSFQVMDAENMQYADNTFDIIHEYGALHHVNLPVALKETARVLKPNGRLICTEALRHNPFIHAYRKRTMHLRTEWEVEHILGVPEIMTGSQYFEKVTIRYFHLAALAAVPLRKKPFFKPFLSFLEKMDDILLKIPYLQRWGWVAVIEYQFPKKNS